MRGSFLQMPLIGLIFCLIPLTTGAAVLRCENLFLQDTDFQKAAENIARFRLDAIREKNGSEKHNRLVEAQTKFMELALRMGDFEKARQLLEEVQLRLQAEQTVLMRDEKEREAESKVRTQSEKEKLRTWRHILKLPYSDFEMRRSELSPDGTKILVVFSDRFELWNAKTFKRLKVKFPPNAEFENAAFSQDSKKVIVVQKEAVVEVDIQTGRKLSEPLQTKLNTRFLGLRPSGTASSLLVQVGNTYFTYIRASRSLIELGPAQFTFISKNGDEVFLVDQNQNTIKKFNLKTGAEIALPFRDQFKPVFAQLTPDKEQMLIIEMQKVHFLNLTTGARTSIDRPLTKTSDVRSVAFSDDGSRLMINQSFSVHLVNLKTKQIQQVDAPEGYIFQSGAFSTDGLSLGLCTGADLLLVDTDSEAPQLTRLAFSHTPLYSSVVAAPNNRGFIVSDAMHDSYLWIRDHEEAARLKAFPTLDLQFH